MKLELEIEEVNKILIVLSKMPYDEVFELIAKIHSQGSAQAEKPATAAKGKAKKGE